MPENNVGLGLVVKPKKDVTIEDLKLKFPSRKARITQDLVDIVNKSQNDPEFQGVDFVDTLITYQNVMDKCSGSISNYIDAVKFCAFLETEGDNFTEAYKRTFAHRDFVKERVGAGSNTNEYKELTSAAARYRRTPMVREILTQCDMPLHLIFGGSRFKAVAVLAHEMENADYAKDRISAADKLLTHVKPPETLGDSLVEGMSAVGQTMQQMLEKQLAESAKNQRELLMKGADISTVQQLGVNLNDPIDVEAN